MSTTDPNEPSDKDLLLEALRGFVDEYDTDRGTWPDDMIPQLDRAHYVIAAVTGAPRLDALPMKLGLFPAGVVYPMPGFEVGSETREAWLTESRFDEGCTRTSCHPKD